MYLGISLSRLDDFENACSAYDKALELEDDYLFHLNYAVMLHEHQELRKAKDHFDAFISLFEELDDETKNCDSDILEQKRLLETAFATGQ